MKKLLISVAIIAAITASFFLLMPKPDKVPATSLPWQIQAHADGTSTVFGINLGGTTFNEAAAVLGVDREVAIMIDSDNKMSLEMYYSRFLAGPLAGKLVLVAEAHPTLLEQLAQTAADAEYLGTGSRKFTLADDQLEIGNTLLIKSLTFIPSANLDAEIIIGRFGEPANIIATSEESSHYLYPQLGLDVILNSEGKETLQYVAPKDFTQLQAPLNKR